MLRLTFLRMEFRFELAQQLIAFYAAVGNIFDAGSALEDDSPISSCSAALSGGDTASSIGGAASS